jgi:hypothetical protein
MYAECPYGNNKKQSVLEFSADPNGTCQYYKSLDEVLAGSKTMIKEADLNIQLYRQIKALNEKSRNRLFNYWSYLFPKDYAREMVTDDVETGAKNKPTPKEKRTNRFDDNFKKKRTK